MRMIIEQETAEKDYGKEKKTRFSFLVFIYFDLDSSLFGETEGCIENPTQTPRNDRFALCRSHITQLGLMMFQSRQNIDLLNTSKTIVINYYVN